MQTIQRCLHPGPQILTCIYKKTTVSSERVTHESYIKLISWVAVYIDRYPANVGLKWIMFVYDRSIYGIFKISCFRSLLIFHTKD